MEEVIVKTTIYFSSVFQHNITICMYVCFWSSVLQVAVLLKCVFSWESLCWGSSLFRIMCLKLPFRKCFTHIPCGPFANFL